MKKILFLIILLTLFFPIYVEADTNCGEYTVSNGSWPTWCYGGGPASGSIVNGNFILGGYLNLGSVTSCPEIIYINDPTKNVADSCEISLSAGSKQFGSATRVHKLEPSDKYKNITACRDTTYEYIKECACMPAALTDLTNRIYSLIKIAAPALLLIVGGFDLIKAMSAQDEKAIGKARQKLVKKFIAAAAVFLIFTIVQFLVSTLTGGSENTLKCVDYILNGYKA